MASFSTTCLKGEVFIKVPSNRGADLGVNDAGVAITPAIKTGLEGLAGDGLLRLLASTKEGEGKHQDVFHAWLIGIKESCLTREELKSDITQFLEDTLGPGTGHENLKVLVFYNWPLEHLIVLPEPVHTLGRFKAHEHAL